MSGGKDKRREIILPKHRVVNEEMGWERRVSTRERSREHCGDILNSIKFSYISDVNSKEEINT